MGQQAVVLIAAVAVMLVAGGAVAIVRLRLARGAAEEQSRRFFDLSHDLLAFAGFDGRLHAVNPAWQRTLGWTAEELLQAVGAAQRAPA